jgi:hypothetical protein
MTKAYSALSALLIILFGLMSTLTSCDRVSQVESRFQACLANEWTGGEDLLPAMRELEDAFLSAGYLTNRSKAGYAEFLSNLIENKIVVDPQDVAPNVRDFWFLTSPATFRAYPYCTEQLVASGTVSHSFTAMHSVYMELNTLNEDESERHLRELIESITDEDFEKILYRGAILIQLLRMINR